ncbi:MAG: precorrin-8X methylmutase [Actinomycetota bacterium]|nr:precorrin-8X methylmutase [Actinomycetota bacterium]
MKIIRNHIEEESFKIIDDLMGNPKLDPEEKEIRSRITHAAGDAGLYWKVDISKKAVDASEDALRSKCNIITDSRMVEAGIRKKWLTQNGNKYFCAIDKENIFEKSNQTGKTRAALSMRALAEYLPRSITVIGNAPTALLELLSMIKEDENLKPSLIIGIPVGFVGAADSKKYLSSQSDIPFITLPGTRGGSNLASAVFNALINIYIMRENADYA